METAQQRKPNATKQVQRTEKLYMENTLLRVPGALFCHDPKRAAMRTQKIALGSGGSEKIIVIRPDPKLGQPGQLAHKIFIALLKKHSDYGRPIRKQVSFAKREIMRMVGRQEWGGRDSEQLARALYEIHHTFIKTSVKNQAGKFIERSFNIFPEILIERREFASDPIEACTITLADPIITSLQDEHFTCLNHGLMAGLGTIGQALYMRLFFHFGNLHDGRNGKRLFFRKRYDAICTEWLGGLTILKHKSRIVGEQLGQHIDQLVAAGFLASYMVKTAENGDGFVIVFRPGVGFFEDYDRFYRRRQQRELQWAFHDDRQQVSEPLKVAYLFTEKRTGHPVDSIAFVPSKDVETAKLVLAALGFDEVPAFLDYALAESKKTHFDIKTLGGTKQYLASFLAVRQRKAADQAQQAARKVREQEDAQRQAYDRYRRSAPADIFAALPKSEQGIIKGLAQTHAAKFEGSLQDSMADFGRIRFTIERHGEKLITFEQWQSSPMV